METTVCPSCTQLTQTADQCEFCGHPLTPQSASGQGAENADPGSNPRQRTVIRPATRPKIPVCVQLGVTNDRTGSSQAFQTGIPLTFETVLDQVGAKARETRVWLQSHGDLDEGQDYILHSEGTDAAQAKADMRAISYGGGGPPHENHLDAIQNITNLVPWTNDISKARGAILAFTTAESKPLRTGASPSELGKQIRDRGLLLYLISEPTPLLEELRIAADGLMFPISNNPDPNELQRVAAQLAASIIASVTQGSTRPLLSTET